VSDQGKSNLDEQGFQLPILDKETSAFLHEPSLARLITIEPNDTVNPDQDIKPMFTYVISMSWKDQCINETMANVYNPSGKLCGSITMHRLRILYSAFRHSQLHQPDTHKQYGHLDFPTASGLARLSLASFKGLSPAFLASKSSMTSFGTFWAGSLIGSHVAFTTACRTVLPAHCLRTGQVFTAATL